MRFIVNESPVGELFFSMPRQKALDIAEEQICLLCREAAQGKGAQLLEYELEQMKRTKTAYHFLILREISLLSREQGHPVSFNGGIGGSYIFYLLGVTPVNPLCEPTIAPQLIWATSESYNTPDFEICISSDVRPLIQKRLDEKFGFEFSQDAFFYRIDMPENEVLASLKSANLETDKFDTGIYTAVLQGFCPEAKNITCDFKQLVNIYAYKMGSFINEIPLEALLSDDAIVTRDKLFLALISNGVPTDFAAEVVKKGVWSNEKKKADYISRLSEYSLPQAVINAFKNAENLWNVPSCASRLYISCQKEYEKRR